MGRRVAVWIIILTVALAPVPVMAQDCKVETWDPTSNRPLRITCGSLQMYALQPAEVAMCQAAVERSQLLPRAAQQLELCDGQRAKLLGSQEDLSLHALELQREVDDLREKAGSRWRWLEVVGVAAIVGVVGFAGGFLTGAIVL